ncbi:MAG TPA: pectinesterase family protein [Bacteroidota bacterium]|nr:pectinesterase family protein [Bacteroidota bacterium]
MNLRRIIWIVLLSILSTWYGISGYTRITVSLNGDGDFTSIQKAIDAAKPEKYSPVMILIHNGLYPEKIFIQKSYLTLVGEDRDSTRIEFAELRENWTNNHHGSDWGAGVVNIDTGTTDITLANLTVYNNYGWKFDVFNKHQFAIRGAGTRIMLLHCKVASDGGDALSLWNKDTGMYYHADCIFEGWVDFVCPRGWCYIRNSTFYGHNRPSASIWHDGSKNKNQKFVITESYFDGVPGFPLGRNHLDGQIYLLNCRFSKNMADRPFYRPPSSPREWTWGDRHYFYDCHRDGGDFSWFRNNLERAEGSPSPEQITAAWTFDHMWNPEDSMPSILPFAFQPVPHNNSHVRNVSHVALSWIPGRDAVSHEVYFGSVGDLKLKGTPSGASMNVSGLTPGTTYAWRVDEVRKTGKVTGETWTFSTGK